MQAYKYKYTLSFADIDPEYKMTINAVLCYFQDAIARFLTYGHVGPKDIIKNGMAWVITEFHSKIRGKMPVWPSTTDVEVWLSDITESKTHVDYKMSNENGDTFATGTSTWAIIDTIARRPVRCLDLVNLTTLHDTWDKIVHNKFRFPSEGREIGQVTHKVTATDIDFNGHTNNQSYVRLASSMAPIDFSKSHTIKGLHVRFAKESFLGDELCCSLKETERDKYTSAITKDGEKNVVCQITSEWTSAENTITK